MIVLIPNRQRRHHPGFVDVWSQGSGASLEWCVDQSDEHADSFGIMASFDNEADAQRYAARWRRENPLPEGFADE
jgi:hypothetical protein